MRSRSVFAVAALTVTAVLAGATAASAGGLVGAHPANVNALDGIVDVEDEMTADNQDGSGDFLLGLV